MLLYWCNLSPEGQSSIAAIRFAAPVNISSIRLFPNGAQPFANCPDVVAQTEPAAFFLEVLMNSHPTQKADLNEKSRPVNALIPTVIAYAGGQVDFTVNMGPDHATRLMIVKGNFDTLSVAIYGEVIVESPPPPEIYEARALPLVESTPLSKTADPSIDSDPATIAKRLLSLIPDSPPLPLVVRLMFCLKPSDSDWDLPEFPYLHADLESLDVDELDIESVIQLLSIPVRDDTPYENLLTFAHNVSSCVSIPKNCDEAYLIAKLLSVSASQHPGLARALLSYLDLGSLFTAQTLDERNLLCLLDAATNVDIARHMNNVEFLGMLKELEDTSRWGILTQVAAQRLASRISDWQCFEDALSNTRGDFNRSWNLLKDVGTEEQSLGMWLESMILHEDIVAKLAENPILVSLPSHSPLHIRNKINIVSHDAFIASVRAFIGISGVLAVWAWADSLGNDVCRERALALLHLWQGLDGYREIVNHLMLLRQLTRRLNWITSENDPPRQSGVLAEKVIFNLANDPRAALNDDFVQVVLSLKSPLSFIPEHELLAMRKNALVYEDGLPAAVEELMFSSDHPLSLRRIRTLRVSLAIIKQHLDDPEGELRTLEAFWDEHSPGIVTCLIEILIGVSDDLCGHFGLLPTPQMNQALAEQLFSFSDELLQLIIHLSPAYPLTSRTLRRLTIATADVFVCTDAADMTYSQTSRAYISARGARQACLDLVHELSKPEIRAEPGRHGAEVIFRSLLQHTASGDRDPVYHTLQVFAMIDYILPEPSTMISEEGPSFWITSVLPGLLDELRAFLGHLDPENKAHLVKRMVRLDNDVLGIGPWLLTEELQDITKVVEVLATHPHQESYKVVLHHQVTVLLRFFLELVKPSSNSSKWCLDAIANTPDLSRALDDSLTTLLDNHVTSNHLQDLILVLSQPASIFDPSLRFTLILAALRVCCQVAQPKPLLLYVSDDIRTLPSTAIKSEPLRDQIGQTLAVLASRELDSSSAEIVISILEWLDLQANRLSVLCGITPELLSSLFTSLSTLLPNRKHATLETLRSKFTTDENLLLPPPTATLDEELKLSIHDLDSLMRQDIPTPSTPQNGAKTPDILGVVISPPTALLRSQVPTTGLTKTYANNDFRQLRQAPSARQNTSRLPSMHVDVGINGRLTL